jgi:hypothetical protein
MRTYSFLILFIFFLLGHSDARAQIIAEAEGGVAFTSYNEIRIPGDVGNTFDAAKDLSGKAKFVYRFRAGYRLNDKHNFFVLVAPLKLQYNGEFNNQIQFNGDNFSPDERSRVTYVFNSYRLTYRYDFITTPRLRFGAGITAKIRDAYIQVAQNGESSKKKNTGFVPLINVMLNYNFNDTYGVILEGDGLATGQGRAFDFQLSVPIRFDEFLGVKVGYRLLEGGADNDEVYNFNWVNYIQAGIFYNMY